MSRDRLLVIDADMPKRLAPELEKRGRRAVTVSKLRLAEGVKDAELLRGLAALFDGQKDWVLVTGDDRMPLEHAPGIAETRATLAIIHPAVPDGLTQHAWRLDVVHRHAHSMQRQQPLSVRRYTLGGSTVWTPRRRHLIEMRVRGGFRGHQSEAQLTRSRHRRPSHRPRPYGSRSSAAQAAGLADHAGRLLLGNGTAPNLAGVITPTGPRTIGTYTRSAGTSNELAILKAAVGTRGSSWLEPDTLVINPLNWLAIRAGTDTSGQYTAAARSATGPTAPAARHRCSARATGG